MSYSTLATVAISLAFVAVAVAVAAAIRVRARRRHWADGALALMVVLLAGAAASAFVAAAQSEHDLQMRTRRVLSLAASAERAAHTRSGRYTTSVAHLERLSPALAAEMRLDGAHVNVDARARTDSVRLHVSLGSGNPAALTLRSGAR